MNPWRLSDDELKAKGAEYTAKEMCQQPDAWEETIGILQKNAAKINDFIKPLLARKDVRIVFTGAGTSAYAGDIAAPYLREQAGLEAFSFATTDIVATPHQFLVKDKPTILVSFARSGDSPESIGAYDLAEQLVDELYQVVITCNSEGSLAKRASMSDDGHTLLLLMPPQTNDKGFAMTSSVSCMLLTSLLIFEPDRFDEHAKLVRHIAERGRRILSEGHGLPELAGEDFERIVFLGSGCLYGLARETCLKVLELTGGRIAAIHETMMGFRHGPKTIINDKTLLVMWFSADAYTHEYDMDLLREFSHDVGDFKVLTVTPAPDSQVAELADYALSVDDDGEMYKGKDAYLALDYLLFDHILALAASMEKGVQPDTPCPSGSVNRVVKGVMIHPLEK